jgi:hypothetical protein
MATQKKSSGRVAKTRQFVIGRERFAKISAVEGIELTDAMKERADERRAKGLTADEYRQTIIRKHRKS